jgi:hypothetical protein
MAEVSNELIYEVLKTLQRDVGEVKSGIGDVKTELNALRGHMISLQQDVHNIYGILGRHDFISSVSSNGLNSTMRLI